MESREAEAFYSHVFQQWGYPTEIPGSKKKKKLVKNNFMPDDLAPKVQNFKGQIISIFSHPDCSLVPVQSLSVETKCHSTGWREALPLIREQMSGCAPLVALAW